MSLGTTFQIFENKAVTLRCVLFYWVTVSRGAVTDVNTICPGHTSKGAL